MLEVVKCNIGPEGYRVNVRIEAVDVPGLETPVPKTAFAGPADKSVDELLAEKPSDRRVSRSQIQELVLRVLADGSEKTRAHIDQVAFESLGVKADTVYKSALTPLREADKIAARKDGFNGGWYWRLTKMDDDSPNMDDEVLARARAGTQDEHPSSATKPKTGGSEQSSIFEDGYPRSTRARARASTREDDPGEEPRLSDAERAARFDAQYPRADRGQAWPGIDTTEVNEDDEARWASMLDHPEAAGEGS